MGPSAADAFCCLCASQEQGAERDLGTILGNGSFDAWLAGCSEEFQRSVTPQVRKDLWVLWHAAKACDAMWGGAVRRQREEEEEEEGEEKEEKALSSTDEVDDSIPGSDGEDEEPGQDDDGAWSSSNEGWSHSADSDDNDGDELQRDEEAAAAGGAGGCRVDGAPEEEPSWRVPMKICKEQHVVIATKADEICNRSNNVSKRVQELMERTQRAVQRARGVKQPAEELKDPQHSADSDDNDDDELQRDEEAAAAGGAGGCRVDGAPEEEPAWRLLLKSCKEQHVVIATKADEICNRSNNVSKRVQELMERTQRAVQRARGERPPRPSRACAPQAEPVETRTLPCKDDSEQPPSAEANHPVEPNRRPEALICTTPLFWLSQAGRHRAICSVTSGGRPLGVSRHERQRGGGDARKGPEGSRSGTARGRKQPISTRRWLMSTCC